MIPVDVSVIIPAWKAAGFIERAVASALASTDVRIQVVVVDDASPDYTFHVISRLAEDDPRVIVDRLPVNGGPSAARNRAIELSGGRYIAILDADDTIAPGRLAKLVALADETGADIVVDNMIEVDEAGRQIGGKPFLKSEAFAAGRDIGLETWVAFNHPMKPGDCLGYLKPLFRQTRLEEMQASYDTNLRNSEDYYFVAHLLAGGARMTYLPDAGYFYQRSPASTSHRLQQSQTDAWLDAEARFRRRFDGRLSASEKAVLDQRGRILRNVHQFVAAMDAVKERKIGALFGMLASDLHATAFTLSTLAKIAAGKALKRKLV
ncbi:MAG: glycosyltransferase family 2 protein [Hyphomonadaceae bacterium]|nr:glycosyltransferase family 2 protein [Hyphomonadaceae bacterium]